LIRAGATIISQTGCEEMDELSSASIVEHTDANNICLHRSIY